MKYFAFFLFLFLSYNSIFSQPELTLNSLPNPGDNYTFFYCDTTNIQPGDGGANSVWDFSKLIILNEEQGGKTNSYINPSEALKPETFPNALYVMKSDTNYQFFRLVNNSIERLGTTFQSGEEILSKPEIIYNLPVSYPAVYEDTFSGSIRIAGQQNMIIKRGGKVLTIADGYGSLKLPRGVFENLLRLKITQTINDTIPPVVAGGPSIISITETDSYIWLNDEFKYGVLNISVIKSSQFVLGNMINSTVTKIITMQDVESQQQMSLSTPKITSPKENEPNVSIPFKIEWEPSELIISGSVTSELMQDITYKIQVSESSDFSENNTKEQEIISATAFNFNEEVNSNELFIRVMAYYGDIKSDWSETVSVTITDSEWTLSTPAIITPENESTVTTYPVYFEWTESVIHLNGNPRNDLQEEVMYLIQVSIEEDFYDDELFTFNYGPTSETNIELEFDTPFKEFFARVKAVYNDYESDWSDVITFNLSTPPLEIPTLISPEDGSKELDYKSVTLKWDSPDENVAFQIRLSSEFSNLQMYVGEVREYVVTDLDPDTEYLWSVRADVMFSDSSEWAPDWKFTTKSASSVKSANYNSDKLTAFPNPATDIVDVKFSLLRDDEITLNVYSVDGNILLSKQLGNLTSGEHFTQLSVNSLAVGTYYIKISGKKINLIRNFIKN